MRNQPVDAAAVGFADPPSTAVLLVTVPAPVVTTAGGAGVVNVSTAPKPLPDAFDVIAQKKYVVPGDSAIVAIP